MNALFHLVSLVVDVAVGVSALVAAVIWISVMVTLLISYIAYLRQGWREKREPPEPPETVIRGSARAEFRAGELAVLCECGKFRPEGRPHGWVRP